MSSTLWDPPAPPVAPHPPSPRRRGTPRRAALRVASAATVAGVLVLGAGTALVITGGAARPDVQVRPAGPPTSAGTAAPLAGDASTSPAVGGTDDPALPADAAPAVPGAVLSSAQGAAYAVGIASSGLRIGATVVRQPDLRTTTSSVAASAVLEVTLARAAWSAIDAPAAGPLSDWYWTFDGAITELERAADTLTRAIQPSTTEADAAILADEVEQHVEAARAAVEASAILLDPSS